jgi:CRISPR-associated endonuclease Csn1
MSKTILGLDLGTNSIGWALVKRNFENRSGEIIGMGSRIIPMTQDIKDEFGKGNSISQTADRTNYRGIRRLRERALLRRERLHRVLNVLSFLPQHFATQIDFEKKFGKFIGDSEPKLAYNGRSFLFLNSFNEMLSDFKRTHPNLLENGKLIPYDWTIYYLRKKALSSKVTKEELAWLILNFNQKRGYYQLRGEEEEENPNKLVEFYSLKVVDVVADIETNKKGEIWYSVHLENGWIYRRSSKNSLDDWKGKTRDFIVSTDVNDDGSIKLDKDGVEKRSFRAPSETDWTLIKKKTEQTIESSGKTVGAYIYDEILKNPNLKIKGKLVRTIERKFYKEELRLILSKQIELQPDLFTEKLYHKCVKELYKSNEAHQDQLNKKDFVHLFLNDIIFYQRPLKSKKSEIGNCSLEFRIYKAKDENGNEFSKIEYLKAIPKSHPLYQEFRLWQWIGNLKIYSNEDNLDVTHKFLLDVDSITELFNYLNERKEIKQESLLKFLLEKTGLKGKILNNEVSKYRWNFVEDKTYPCNETRTNILAKLSKVEKVQSDFLSPEIEQQLWHIIYSVTDKIEYEKALKTFAVKNKIDELSFVDAFKKIKPFDSQFGAYSLKAIKKLLPLMRVGQHWDFEKIDSNSKVRIEKLLTGEYDEDIKNRVREKTIHLSDYSDFQGLPLWLAQYIVYDRHSEAELAGKWNSIADLEAYINEFKQHSLRNPIVEQIILETLRVVKDIWVQFGKSAENFFSEIHIELGREMKHTAEERKRITNTVSENENTNLRIKAFLAELLNDQSVENVRPHSPMQVEALKIYEDGVLKSGIEIPDDIRKISSAAQPTKAEFQKYKLWLDQKYKSPYTGQIIPLHKLFTSEYQIEHIIPQSRFFDDSFSNKVICEAAVNQLKDRQLGLEFIKNNAGRIVELGFGKSVQLLSEESYINFVKENYKSNRSKLSKLLMEEIPEKMIERQLNDTRYISKFISQLLSNIVRSETNDEGVNSKNILPGNGKITSQLKQDWGLNDVWNELILPRFERLNSLTNSDAFTSKNSNGKLIPTVPLELSKGFQKKRIDHRHHALDALVIACATGDHINLLNNQSAKSETKRYDLQRKLRKTTKWTDKEGNERDKFSEFYKPWESFTQDAKAKLETTVVSFKQNLRVINKATNYYEKLVDGKKVKVKQDGVNWAIRKSLHKDTVSGKVELPRIKVPKDKILTATRKSLDTSFNLKTIESITDTGIQKILRNYLTEMNNDSDRAFSPEGIEEMNKNITQYNDGKKHQPINKVRIFELGSKFALGQTGNKKDKYVEAAKGTNLFFAVYQDENGKRNYATIPLNVVIERQKQGLGPVPEKNEKGHQLLFTLSPNDLVYVPSEEEKGLIIDLMNLSKEQANRIYKMVSSTGNECHFIQTNISSLIKNYDAKSKIGEFGSLNKLETTIDNLFRIKEVCYKLKIDRLGNISISN